MIVKFDKAYLSELYYNGKCSDKKHRYQPDIVKRYKRRIDTLNGASCIEALYHLHSLNTKYYLAIRRAYLQFELMINTELSLLFHTKKMVKHC